MLFRSVDPYPYLDATGKKKMVTAQSDLMRKFDEFAFDEVAKSRWQESKRAELESLGTVRRMGEDFQKQLCFLDK